MNSKFRIVCATRVTEAEFSTKTALGRSLAAYGFPFVDLRLAASNTAGLPAVYNAAIRACNGDPAILIFIHDDVHLIDLYWPDRFVQGLREFEVIGVAGNKRRVPRQPAWCFVDERWRTDDARYLMGAVAHGKSWPPDKVSYYGSPGHPAALLDGLLMAAHSDTLLSRGLWFDERFDFHFYDLDFCREAERLGVRVGTWPLPVIHESGGGFGSPSWRRACEVYFDKWGS